MHSRSQRSLAFAFYSLILASVVAANPSRAQECEDGLTVTTTADAGPGSLRQAVDLVCPGGTINFDLPTPATIGLQRPLRIRQSLVVLGPGQELLTIDGQGPGSVIQVGAGTVTLIGMTVFGGNTDTSGGGIINGGSLRLVDVTVANNTAFLTGGGIVNDGVLLLDRVTVRDNKAGPLNNDNAGSGAGIVNRGELVIRDSLFEDNLVQGAGGGGMLYNVTGNVLIERSAIIGNQSLGTDARIGAGAILVLSGTVEIVNTTIAENFAGFQLTSAINNVAGAVTLSHVTLADNASGSNSQLLRTDEGITTLRNTLLANNGRSGDDCRGRVVSIGYNLTDDSICDFTGPGDQLVEDAEVGALDRIGAIPTYPLESGSGAIDGGICIGVDGAPITEDARGLPRPVDATDVPNAIDGCDIGAREMRAADLVIDKGLGLGTPLPGARIDYRISITNRGVGDAEDIVVTDVLPAEVVLAGPVTLTPPQADAELAQTAGDLPILAGNVRLGTNEMASLTVPVLILPQTQANVEITNVAGVRRAGEAELREDSFTFTTCVTAPPVTSTADSGPGSLRRALRIACSPADITFDLATPAFIDLTSGELLVDRPLTIFGPGADQLTIDAGGRSRVFRATDALSLSGMTLRGGSAEIGGGVFASGDRLILGDVAITDNEAERGGGIAMDGGELFLSDSRVIGNRAVNLGAIARGGGFYLENAVGRIDDVLIENNIARGDLGEGAGLWVDDFLALDRCAVLGNRIDGAGNGGGLWVESGADVFLLNSTLADNQAALGDGGAIAVESGATAELAFLSVANNSAAAGGGLDSDNTPPVRILNSIIALNTGGDCRYALEANQNSFGHNIDGDGSCRLDQQTDQPGTDPLLLPLGDNGGPTPTLALDPLSPAIDAGTCVLLDGNAVGVDQRRSPRPVGADCDVGAFEAPADSGPGNRQ
ncbi:MAG: choice-of-anchor Q domain-containing protein [Pseudomonadota bacterium]